jgi:hypothetical protein
MNESPIPPRVAANDASPADKADLPLDAEIAALLEFAPVPRKVKRPDGWTAERQREFIHRLALNGSPTRAAQEMGKNISGIEAIYKEKGAESFRAAWDGALALGQRRKAAKEQGEAYAGRAPGLNVRGQAARPERLPGQILNEFGEWEDEASIQRRAEKARDEISNKLLRARRLYLAEISSSPGKRAAFEILTELPIDWDRARRLEPQPDEPWRCPRMQSGDMLLTAENGWLGDVVHAQTLSRRRRSYGHRIWADRRAHFDRLHHRVPDAGAEPHQRVQHDLERSVGGQVGRPCSSGGRIFRRVEESQDQLRIADGDLDVGAVAEACSRVEFLTFWKESAHTVERRLTHVIEDFMQELDHGPVEEPQNLVGLPIQASVFGDRQARMLLLLEEEAMRLPHELDVLAVEEIETVPQIDHRSDNGRRLDTTACFRLPRPLHSAVRVGLPEIGARSEPIILLVARPELVFAVYEFSGNFRVTTVVA